MRTLITALLVSSFFIAGETIINSVVHAEDQHSPAKLIVPKNEAPRFKQDPTAYIQNIFKLEGYEAKKLTVDIAAPKAKEKVMYKWCADFIYAAYCCKCAAEGTARACICLERYGPT